MSNDRDGTKNMSTRQPLIAGNWKMNGLSQDGVSLANALAEKYHAAGNPAFEMLVCPPATLIGSVGAAIADSGVKLGGQNCHHNEKGAHTGEISPSMLTDLGCGFVILGHSERRADNGEDDALINAKTVAAQGAGLITVICVGETEAQRDAGDALSVVSSQLKGSLPDGVTAANTVVAYEPVWAIGTGRVPTLKDIDEVHQTLRSDLTNLFGAGVADGIRLLYGGSVKPDNAAEILTIEDVDGALVGGASLDAEQFWAIGESCP